MGTKTADRVFYSETQTDTDFIVAPTPTGTEFSWLLRSPDAPQRLILNVDLPAGGVIRRAQTKNPIPGDPPQSLEIASGDDVLAYVRPPIVYDADGVSVPAEMTVEGRDKIVITAKHRDQDLHYPLYADPVVDLQGNQYNTWYGWSAAQIPNPASPGVNYYGFRSRDCAYNCAGPYMSMPTNTWFSGSGTEVSYSFRAPANTYINRVQLAGVAHKQLVPGYTFSQFYDGIANAAGTAWQPGVNWNWSTVAPGVNPYYAGSNPFVWSGQINQPGVYQDVCCDSTDANQFKLSLTAVYAGGPFFTYDYSAYLTAAGSGVYLGDQHPPVWNANSVKPPNKEWVDDTSNRTHTIGFVSAHDDGLGLNGITLSGGASTGNGTLGNPCTGHPWTGPCDHDYATYGFSYQLNEGNTTLTLQARDVVGNTMTPQDTHSWTEKIDRTAPAVDLPTVPDEDENGSPLEVPDGVYVAVNQSQYALTIKADDAYSGIKSVKLLAPNGSLVDQNLPSCSPECPKTLQTSLHGATTALTEFQIYTVVISDNASHTSSSPVRLIADRIPPAPPTGLRVADFGGLTATITWDTVEDSDLSAGRSGSGTWSFEYRYRRLLQQYTPWTPTANDSFDLTAILAEPITVEVRQIDHAGNVGAQSTATVLAFPQPATQASPQPGGGSNVINVLQQFTDNGTTIARGGSEVVLRTLRGVRYIASSGGDGRVRFANVPDGAYDVLVANGPTGPERQYRVTVAGSSVSNTLDKIENASTKAERENCALYPNYCPFMFDDAYKARKLANRLFTRNPPAGQLGSVDVYDNTLASTFKHAYWLALMVNSIAQNDALADDFAVALGFSQAHEDGIPKNLRNDRNTAIDVQNNRVGYRLGIANSPDARGKKHNDVFYCNALRQRVKRALQVGFKKGKDNMNPIPESTNLVYRYKYPGGNRNDPPQVKLRPKSDFADSEPCGK